MKKLASLLLALSATALANPQVPYVLGPDNTLQYYTRGINFRTKVYFLTGTDDPTFVAQKAPKGSFYLRYGGGTGLYIKMDDGLTTSWTLDHGAPVSLPLSSANHAITRWSGTGGSSLLSSSATIDDTGIITATGFVGPVTGAVTGNTTGTHTGAVVGNASTSSALDHNPAACPVGQVVSDIAADGTLTCVATLTLGATAPNQIFAGPATAPSAAASMRPMVVADLPLPVTPSPTPNSFAMRDGNGDSWFSRVWANLTGNVTGNLTGNVTGNTNGTHTGAVVGNVTGDLTGNSAGTHTGAVVGNASTATALASNPTDCTDVTYGANSIAASGNLTCVKFVPDPLPSGNVPIISGTGYIAGSTLYWDDTNHVLGINKIPTSTVQADIASSGTTTNLRLTNTNSGSGNTQFQQNGATLFSITENSPSGSTSTIDLVPSPADGSSTAQVRLFRNTNTSGTRQFLIQQGNNTNVSSYNFTASATGPATVEDGYAGTPLYTFRRAEGTGASPTATTSGLGLGALGWRGYQSTTSAFATADTAQVQAFTTESFTSTAQGTKLIFQTTPNSSTTKATAMELGQDGYPTFNKFSVAGVMMSDSAGRASPVPYNTALNTILPSQTGNAGKLLSTDGATTTSWVTAAVVPSPSPSAGPIGAVESNNTVLSAPYGPVSAPQYAGRTVINNMTTLTAVSPTPTASDATLQIDDTSNDVNVQVPSAATLKGKIFTFQVSTYSTGHAIILTRNGSDTICGQTSIRLSGLRDGLTLQSDGGTAWNPVGPDGCFRHESSRINITGASACSITRQSHSFIGSAAAASSKCTLTFTSSIFSTAPDCTLTNDAGGNGYTQIETSASTSSVVIGARDAATSTSQNWPITVNCSGPR